jgi:hypothetical protein
MAAPPTPWTKQGKCDFIKDHLFTLAIFIAFLLMKIIVQVSVCKNIFTFFGQSLNGIMGEFCISQCKCNLSLNVSN